MKTSYNAAGVCEAYLEQVLKGPFAGCWELKSLFTQENFRRKGLARALMEVIVDDADVARVRLHLTARPVESDGISPEKLRKFYEEFSFENYPGMGRSSLYSMLRKPR